MIIHRYDLRPNLDIVPTQFPQGEYVLLDEERNIRLCVNDKCKLDPYDIKNFDVNYYMVLDNEDNIYEPFYEWMLGTKDITTLEDLELCKRYNAAMDNLSWLIRQEEREVEVKTSVGQPQITLYEMNQQAYQNVAPYTEEELEDKRHELTYLIMTQVESPYAMLLCRELNDYTIFKKNTLYPYEVSAKEVIELLQSRGPILDIRNNKDNNYIECWVRYREDKTPHMYVFFDCGSFIVDY